MLIYVPISVKYSFCPGKTNTLITKQCRCLYQVLNTLRAFLKNESAICTPSESFYFFGNGIDIA
jgi:hypothetical protein